MAELRAALINAPGLERPMIDCMIDASIAKRIGTVQSGDRTATKRVRRQVTAERRRGNTMRILCGLRHLMENGLGQYQEWRSNAGCETSGSVPGDMPAPGVSQAGQGNLTTRLNRERCRWG